MPELELNELLKETKSGSSVPSNVAPQGVSPAIRLVQAKRAKQRDIMHLTVEYSGKNGVNGIEDSFLNFLGIWNMEKQK